MITIYWSDITNVDSVSLDNIKEKLSETDQKRYGNLVRAVDRVKFLSGRYLVHHFLQESSGKASITEIIRDSNKRPFIPKSVAFSISHSENTVAAAFSMVAEGKIGLDIEKVKVLEGEEDYLIAFSEEEKTFLQNTAEDKSQTFFKLWTRKESLLKAIGTGFLMDPTRISVLADNVSCNNNEFFFSHPDIQKDLMVCLCADFPSVLNVEQITLT